MKKNNEFETEILFYSMKNNAQTYICVYKEWIW